MTPEFKQLMQIGIIVRDIDAAIKNYEELGIGPWERGDLSNDQIPFLDLKFDGKEITPKGIVMKGAFLQMWGLEIELLEPVADTAYKKWLDEKGPGLHHLAFSMNDSYDKVLSDYEKKTGKAPWIRGTGINGKMDYSYLDYSEELGMIVECYHELQEGKPVLDYDMEAKRV